MTDETTMPSNEELDYLSRIPTCPFCNSPLSSAADDYTYKKLHPDTRWFWCGSCEAHLGRHRMRRSWTVDPYDLPKMREKGYLS